MICRTSAYLTANRNNFSFYFYLYRVTKCFFCSSQGYQGALCPYPPCNLWTENYRSAFLVTMIHHNSGRRNINFSLTCLYFWTVGFIIYFKKNFWILSPSSCGPESRTSSSVTINLHQHAFNLWLVNIRKHFACTTWKFWLFIFSKEKCNFTGI